MEPESDDERCLVVDDSDILSVEAFDPVPYAAFELTLEPARADDTRPPLSEPSQVLQPRREPRRFSAAVVVGGALLGFALATLLFRVLGA